MNKETIALVRSKWGKLTKYSFQAMQDSDLNDLVPMLRQTYGYSRLQAERECHEFQLTLKPVINNIAPERVTFVNGQRRHATS